MYSKSTHIRHYLIATLSLTLASLVFSANVMAATVPYAVSSGGELIGVNGVNVAGTLYDVSFGDTAVATFYSGSFPFPTLTTAHAATTALSNLFTAGG